MHPRLVGAATVAGSAEFTNSFDRFLVRLSEQNHNPLNWISHGEQVIQLAGHVLLGSAEILPSLSSPELG